MAADAAALKREAYALFEELLDLDPAAQAHKLELLRQVNPDLHARVAALLEADRSSGESLTHGATRGPQPGDAIGTYRLERRLGRGGMGEVWLAQRQDGVSAAPVALKLLHPHLAHSLLRQRFRREGRILGELNHPNIAHLYDAGIAADQVYIALEYVDGSRIDEWCEAHQLGVDARLRLFLQVCDAVAHAHAHLVVHRDLKPSNILVGFSGVIKLLDFGIAKMIGPERDSAGQTELTRMSGRMLTPEYAAPEQITGDAITTATDVYALGVVLYLLLTGERPYGAADAPAAQIEREVLETEPRPPSQLRKGLAADLDTIVGKALKKSPAQRYATVVEFAEDLRRHLDHLPVLAQRDSFAYRARKYLRRHRVAAGAAAAIFVSLVAGIGVALWQAGRAERESIEARAQADRVKRTKDFFVSIFESSDPMRRADGSPQTVGAVLDEAIKRVETDLTSDPKLHGDLLNDLGTIKEEQGDIDTARKLFEEAVQLHERALSPDDPSLAISLANRGLVEHFAGDAAAGRPYLERAIAIFERQPDADPDELAKTRNALAGSYNAAGDYEGAARLYRQALDHFRKSPGPDQRFLASTLNSLAAILVNLHRDDEAKPYYDECVTIVEKNLGKTSPNLFPCYLGLGQIAAGRKDLAAEVDYYERALANARANFSGDHAWIAAALVRLGQGRLDQGRYADAGGLFGEAEPMIERMGGNLGMKIAALLGLAQVQIQLKDPTQAVAYADRGIGACAGVALDYLKERCGKLKAVREQAVVLAAH